MKIENVIKIYRNLEKNISTIIKDEIVNFVEDGHFGHPGQNGHINNVGHIGLIGQKGENLKTNTIYLSQDEIEQYTDILFDIRKRIEIMRCEGICNIIKIQKRYKIKKELILINSQKKLKK